MPKKPNGSFDVVIVEERTKEVAESLTSAVNRRDGTNGWNIPKFVDMLHLPITWPILEPPGGSISALLKED